MDTRSAGDRTAKVLVIGFLILLVNSSYLAAYADPTLLYFSNVALHLLLGSALAVHAQGHVIRVNYLITPHARVTIVSRGRYGEDEHERRD